MKKVAICASVVNNDIRTIKAVEPLVELFEIRIDLIGNNWQNIARQIKKPWIACNRMQTEGGSWQEGEARRKEELLKAIQLGANIVDIELATPNLGKIVPLVKKQAKCLLSYHDLEQTPSIENLKRIVKRQLVAGADICKVVTFAQNVEDNLTIIKLIQEFTGVSIIAFAMGSMGLSSRILSPLIGGYITYAAIDKDTQSAPGQITVDELYNLYQMVK
jgi:3-dehydroquinate dehydratase type I